MAVPGGSVTQREYWSDGGPPGQGQWAAASPSPGHRVAKATMRIGSGWQVDTARSGNESLFRPG